VTQKTPQSGLDPVPWTVMYTEKRATPLAAFVAGQSPGPPVARTESVHLNFHYWR